MSFFARLFGKTQPARATGAKAGEARNPADITLVRAAAAKHVESQRAAAIDQMPFNTELVRLASNAPSVAQKAAQQRLAQLLDKAQIDIPQLATHIADRLQLLSIAALASNAAHFEQAAALITDNSVWSHLVTAGASAKLRQLAAERIEDPAQLRQALKETRGKDKNAYKIIRRKCDELQSQEKQAAQRQKAIVALADTIERHSYKPFDGAFVATLEHLSSQWDAADEDAPPELKPRVAHAIERAREVISEHVQAMGAQAAKSHAIETADPQRQLIVEEMRQALAGAYASDAEIPADLAARTAAQLERWVERWRDTTRHKGASAADVAAFDQLRHAVQRAAQLLDQHGTLRQQLDAIDSAAPGDLAARYQTLRATLAVPMSLSDVARPGDVALALSTVLAWDKQRAQEQAAAAAALNHLTGLIRRANRAINDGRSAQASGTRRAIAEALQSIASVPAYITGQLEQLDKRLNELQDWKSYAVAPKRAALIEQMEALTGVEQHPAQLADEIKRLQEEWKSLTRGSAEQSDADWQRFHQAAQTAYLPCREYFAAQAALRAENLEQRKSLVARLMQFDEQHDWANADWKEVARVLRNARQEWRNYSVVERAANKPVQVQFDALIKNMHDRLEAQYTTNTARRQSLIEQVQRLAGESDTRKAIDDVKRLQTAWKTAGLVPHAEDQRLWQEFRQHCDAVYRKSQEAYSVFVAELQANKATALQLIAQAEQLVELADRPPADSAVAVKQLRTQFEALGELPHSESADLQSRFARALDQYDRAVAQQRLREEQRSWSHLFAASNEVRLLQLASLDGAHADLESLRQSVRATIDGVQQWPKGGLQAIERKLAQPVPGEVTANEVALRQLCIRAEILSDTPTPAADQQLRREQQLQSLVQGMGQFQQTGRAALEALVFEWIAVGPTRTALYYELLERFNACFVKAQSLSP